VLTRRVLIGAGIATGAALALLRSRASESPGTRHDPVAAAMTGAAAIPDVHPAVVARRDWGADEARRSGRIDFDATVEKIVVHHTGTENGVADWAGEIRRIYEFETASGYRDIAYHFLIAPDGVVYEGRWARDPADGSPPDACDARGRLVRGGHARHCNPRTLGIALLGDYTATEPPDAAVLALTQLVEWHCAHWQVDPQGHGPYTTTTGAVLDVPHVVAHHQLRPTLCPGAHLDARLTDLRTHVATALAERAAGV
jgi:hypothetical protein